MGLIGIDEAGRGAWAGPLVVAAVSGESKALNFSKDSKTLTATKRKSLLTKIQREADEIGVGWASNQEIDKLGLSDCLVLAARRAFSHLSNIERDIVIDGPYDFLKIRGTQPRTIVGADSVVAQVSAASIVAKVFRDRYMINLDSTYNCWEFTKHKGYGTKLHQQCLKKCGISQIHRRSYKPIKEADEKFNQNRSGGRA